ncbi:hypothetical protein GCM10011344_41460 [Dokdonia pacifica]|uniref:Uncharacterized protein n=1 Tax=Dokdonia pacifica TaxID=1627892 RepID=A0A239ACJ8_9FLAO|nr:hypothetical protein [Dokdonia pacifica]GGG36289.1 hypothetical protein GCM10011344_41460 [Dokdonia pacifica]SNR93386.1 hypothetical protein SAMN06265376_104333 [Dokdonia pacifica]
MYLGNNNFWKIFPSVDTLAYYHPLGNFITFNKLSEEQFDEVYKSPDKFSGHQSIIVHEVQHWLDHIGTLWGVQKLAKTYRAFDSIFHGDESEMFKVKELHDSFKGDKFATYYSEIYNKIQGSAREPWRYSFSMGLRYDSLGHIDNSKPIFFTKFNSHNDLPVARVPLSTASLLETTATFAEMASRLVSIYSLDEESLKIELKLYSDEIFKKLYNSDLSLYSVGVHVTTNILNIKDPIRGYEIASRFATLSLNLTNESFEKLNIPKSFKVKEWQERPVKLIELKDRGFAFVCLLMNYAEEYGAYNLKNFNIDHVLEASGLSNSEQLEKDVNNEILNISKELSLEQNTFFNLFTTKVATGSASRNAIGIAQQRIETESYSKIKGKDLPYIICNDTYFEYDEISLQEVIDKLRMAVPITREEWWAVYEFCELKTDHFSEICGV